MSSAQSLDTFLPRFDVESKHQTKVNADASLVYEAVRHLDMSDSLPVKLLFALRSLPAILYSRQKEKRLQASLDGLLQNGFILLKEDPPREIVLALVGKFWTASGCIQRIDAEAFKHFDRGGFAKAVWRFLVDQQPDGRSLLSTGTRVLCTDDDSRKKFQLYWSVVGPFSGLIRKEALRIIKQNAERSNHTTQSAS
jgi:hypothetical protein